MYVTMSYTTNNLHESRVLFSDASSSLPSSIPVNKLYLSHLLEDNDNKGILITSVKIGNIYENRISLKLDHPDNFGDLQLSYKGPRFYDYFPPNATSKVSKILIKKLTTKEMNFFPENTIKNILGPSWDIMQIKTKKESDCNYLFKKAIEDNYTAILAIQFEIINRNNLSRKFTLYLHDDNGTPLHRAAAEEDIKTIEALLKCNLDINERNKFGWTPLHVAIDLGKSDVVDYLISNGANVNAQHNLIETPLHCAVAVENVDVVDILLKKGANYKLEDKFNRTPFHLAAKQKSLDIIKVFLNNRVDTNTLNSRGRSPLFYLSKRSHSSQSEAVYKETYLAIINVLLRKEANVNFQDSEGRTPLHHAVINGNIEFMRALLDCKTDANIQDKSGINPLHLACQYSKNKCIQVLMDFNINIDAVDAKRRTALHMAIQARNDDAVKLILRKNPNINMSDNHEKTALHLAITENCLSIIELLLENNADVNLKDASGKIALHLALKNCNIPIKIITSILNVTSDINTVDVEKTTALHEAVGTKNYSAVELILKKNPNINMSDNHEKTALHLAITENCLPIIELLLENNADVNLKDASGKIALHLALKNCNIPIKIITSILNVTSDINTVDVEKTTALHAAVGTKNYSAVELILKKNPNINMSDNHEKTALHLAITENCLPIIELLLENNADVNLKDASGKIALHVVSEKRNITINIIKSISNSSNDINAKDNIGRAAVHYAALNHNVSILRCLLEENVNVNAKDSEGKTPLHLTMNPRDNFFQCVKALLDHKADINAVDVDLISPLHLACWTQNSKVVEHLIENGADSIMRDKDGRTVFHYVCMGQLNEISSPIYNIKNNVKKILDVFVEENISVNCVDIYGKTPLHYVVEDLYLSFMNKLLLNIGADINIVDKDHNSPFDYLTKQKFYIYNSSNDLVTLYKQHIIKMKVLKLWVREKTLDEIYKVDDKEYLKWIQSYEGHCSKEIDSMKMIHLPHSNKTYYDFLKKNLHDAVNFTRNHNIVKVMQSKICTDMFPIYGNCLKFHFCEVFRRSYLYERIQNASKLFIFKNLPTDSMYEIFKYLNNSELNLLLKAMELVVSEK